MYREYTWRFMTLLVVLSVSFVLLLYVLRMEKGQVIRTWDFTKLDRGEWEWTFPGLNAKRTVDGATFILRKTSPGPRHVRLAIPVDLLTKVRVWAHVTDLETGEKIPPDFELYWARTRDMEAASGRWPYSAERGVRFDFPDRKIPNMRAAQPGRFKQREGKLWNGTIQALMIAIKLPSESEKGYKIHLAKIELIEGQGDANE